MATTVFCATGFFGAVGSVTVTQAAVADRLHPHGLPDACGAGVIACHRIELERLLAGRLLAAAEVAGGVNNERVRLSGLHERSDVERKGTRASEMTPDELSVDINL